MSYAIIRTGGKQYRVSVGDRLKIEKIEAEVGQEIPLSDVLAVGEGAQLNVDAATLNGQSVQAKVVRHGRGTKVHIWKWKRRKGSDHHQGHRQDFTEVQILALPAIS
jgi:large subunit ribosomal protein L21